MIALEARPNELEEKLANAKEEPVPIHPNMGNIHRQRIANLATALNDKIGRTKVAENMRGLSDRIVVTPDPETGKPVVDLEGDLAGILSPSQTSKKRRRHFCRRRFAIKVGCGGTQQT